MTLTVLPSIQSEVVDHVMVESPEIYTRRKETAAMLEVRVSTYLPTVNHCIMLSG